MPFKHYHGRTGIVFNVNKRAVGVIVNKEVSSSSILGTVDFSFITGTRERAQIVVLIETCSNMYTR